MSKFYVSKTQTKSNRDLNKRYILHSNTHEVVCVFNPFHMEWKEKDEKYLQIVLDALENSTQEHHENENLF